MERAKTITYDVKGCISEIHSIGKVVPMQCTGLKDKSGKLIWEGDVVAYKLPYRGNKQLGKIFFDDSFCSFRLLGENMYIHNLAPIETIEVIGNIYEHPHLLDNETKRKICEAINYKECANFSSSDEYKSVCVWKNYKGECKFSREAQNEQNEN
jgi:hypothetical protein